MNAGFGLGILALPVMVGGIWLTRWGGITDIVHGTFYVLLLLVGPMWGVDRLLSRGGRKAFRDDSDKATLIYVGAVAALAYVLYSMMDRVPYDNTNPVEGPVGRYLGCMIVSWSVLPVVVLVLDRVFHMFDESVVRPPTARASRNEEHRPAPSASDDENAFTFDAHRFKR